MHFDRAPCQCQVGQCSVCGEEHAFARSCTTSRVDAIEVVKVHPINQLIYTPGRPVHAVDSGIVKNPLVNNPSALRWAIIVGVLLIGQREGGQVRANNPSVSRCVTCKTKPVYPIKFSYGKAQSLLGNRVLPCSKVDPRLRAHRWLVLPVGPYVLEPQIHARMVDPSS